MTLGWKKRRKKSLSRFAARQYVKNRPIVLVGLLVVVWVIVVVVGLLVVVPVIVVVVVVETKKFKKNLFWKTFSDFFGTGALAPVPKWCPCALLWAPF